MHLDECNLDGIDAISAAPIERKEPEDKWVKAKDDGAIPPSLYDLYRRANFLSFGSAPRFLSDEDNLLFSYFGLVLRSIQESLVDAQEQANSFAAAEELVYDPMKQLRGERWEKGADKRARTHFRDLLIALQTSLDALADVVAIFFPGSIKDLEVGRSQFSKIERWLTNSFPSAGLIVKPSEYHMKKLHDSLVPLIRTPHPETDWLPMMRLLRNKAAHLGQPLFRQVGLHRAEDGKMFAFIPRQWPYLWERLIKPPGQREKNPTPFSRLFRDSLMHQDIVTYSRGLLLKVNMVVAAASTVLNESYERFKDLPENQAALLELQNNSEKYEFESFVNT
jgi:hypothetical protein